MIKRIIFSLIVLIMFFGSLELVSRLFIFPGSYDYIERCIMDQGLHQRKAPGEYRILLFGESTMHGHFLFPRSTIGIWMKLYLHDLLPEEVARHITITNFGRLGKDSGFTTKAFIETIPYKPDLAVFYMAHNDYTLTEHRRIYSGPLPLKERIEHFFGEIPKKSSFLTFINRLYISARQKSRARKDLLRKKEDKWYIESERAPYYNEKEKLLYPGSHVFSAIKKRFEANVEKAITAARRYSVRIIFLEGVSKLKEFEPVKAMHNLSLTKDALKRWEDLNQAAEGLFGGNKFQEAALLYKECLKIDDAYALTYYRIGQCYEYMNDAKGANEYYSIANDKDCFPIRGPSAVNRFYEDIRKAGLKGVDVIKTRDLFEKNSPAGIVGDDLVADQLHPTIRGQALIALEIVRVIYENGLIAPKESWHWDKLRSEEEMTAGLDLDQEFKFDTYLVLAGYVEKRYDKAAEFLEKAAQIKPDSIFAKSWLAWAYWRQGKKSEALEIYKKLQRQAPDEAAGFFKAHPEIAENQ